MQLIHTTRDTTVMEVEVITVEHEKSMQTIWEHEMIREICSWKELAEVVWC
jgi:hypothetical protein